MAAVGKIRTLEGGAIAFLCPACNIYHTLNLDPAKSRPCWKYNGSPDAPTFRPSILAKTGHYVDGFNKSGDDCFCAIAERHPEVEHPFGCHTCHSFVTDGKIQFLNDCTHKFAGKTLPLEDLD